MAYYGGRVSQKSGSAANYGAMNSFRPSRIAEVALGNGLTCTWINNAGTHSAVQAGVPNPAWDDASSDRLGYDGAGHIIAKRYLNPGSETPTASVVGFTTAFDRAGNKFYERPLHAEERSSLYEPFDPTTNLATGGYDSLDRLLQYQRGTLASTGGDGGNGGGSVTTAITLPNTDSSRTYLLDGLGNWRQTAFTSVGGSATTEVRQHNGLNQITSIKDGTSAKVPFTYDGSIGQSNGNLRNDGTRLLKYDALNRLVAVYKDPSAESPTLIANYYYDALNRRIRKTVSNGGISGDIPNGTTDFLYTGWRCVEERNPFGGGGSTDTPTMQYVWGIYLDEIIQQKLVEGVNNFGDGAILYPMQDLLYRTTGLADSSGTVREAFDTDAYGNTLIFRNSGTPPGTVAFSGSDTQVGFPTCPFIFTGQRFNSENGLYYYKRRYYSPGFGRFVSRDPILFAMKNGSFQSYARNSPTRYIDSTGTQDSLPPIDINSNPIFNPVKPPWSGLVTTNENCCGQPLSGSDESWCYTPTGRVPVCPPHLTPHEKACHDTADEQLEDATTQYLFTMWGCTLLPPPSDGICAAVATLQYLRSGQHIRAQLERCLKGL